jgi:hypothetical protein
LLTISLRQVHEKFVFDSASRQLTNSTGGSAAAAGSLVTQLGGTLLGYAFLLELDFLKGRDKLDAPVYTLLTGQEKALGS